MDADNLDKLDAVIGAMTPGDWLPTVSTPSYETGEHYTCVGVTVLSERGLAFFIGDDDPDQDVDNARGIATLRNLAPELLAVARVPPSIRKKYTDLRSSHRCEVVPGTREPCECDWCTWVDALEALDAKLAEVLR